MYALPNKTQHKLIVKVRGGIFNKHVEESGFNVNGLNNLPQPIFHHPISQNGKHNKSSTSHHQQHKQFITPEHNEMIKYVQQSWKGVEQDYKKSATTIINNLDLNGGSASSSRKKSATAHHHNTTTSKPLLLSGSYHHTSTNASKDSTGSGSKQDSFQPFDLEAFWGNRILKRLTEDI